MKNFNQKKSIKNIIFDLGGVIVDIDTTLTIKEFENIGVKNFDTLYTQFKQVDVFDRWDRGEIDSAAFRDAARSITGLPLRDKQIDNAWNAMLMDITSARLQLLEKLKGKYNSYLLSNTNAIHIESFYKKVYDEYGLRNLDNYFHKVYLSYKVGMRKPEPRIFELVLNENNLEASETLFIDDTMQHIESAAKLGINTYHLKPGEESLEDLFDSNLLLVQ